MQRTPRLTRDFAATDAHADEATCRYLIARLSHDMGDVAARDSAATQYEHARRREIEAARSLSADADVEAAAAVVEACRRHCLRI